MIGALIGDVLGAFYEGIPTKRKDFRLITPLSRPTDDTVLSLAVAQAILDAEESLKSLEQRGFAERLREFGRRYPHAGYGGSFKRWLYSEAPAPYGSWGNGSAMRSSAAGWAFNTKEEVLRAAELSALPTHDHPAGIAGAQAVALAVFLARSGASRAELRSELSRRFDYDLRRTLGDIRPDYSFQVSCQKSVPEAIIAFLESRDYVDAVRNAISLRGDADTQACIAGALAEAFYGHIPPSLVATLVARLDGFQVEVLRGFASRFMSDTQPSGVLMGLAGPVAASAADSFATVDVPVFDLEEGPGSSAYKVLLDSRTWRRLEEYSRRLEGGDALPGAFLERSLEDTLSFPKELSEYFPRRAPTAELILYALLNTKRPCLFAESAVRGDGSDWTTEELGLLGDIGVAVPVTVFDNGLHHDPEIHATPFSATLLFIPGALLQAGGGATPADWDELVVDGSLSPERYLALYERRLVPLLKYASMRSRARAREAVVTIPGLGCGQFAGPFRGTLGAFFRDAVREILTRHEEDLGGLRCVWFDPYDECENERQEIGHLSYLVRPLLKSEMQRPQLCRPTDYEEAGDDYSNCDLYSVVAWDHVSWPGNDFYAGARATDDGVKAAATSSLAAMTGFLGGYNVASKAYEPPRDMENWQKLVQTYELRIASMQNTVIIGGAG